MERGEWDQEIRNLISECSLGLFDSPTAARIQYLEWHMPRLVSDHIKLCTLRLFFH